MRDLYDISQCPCKSPFDVFFWKDFPLVGYCKVKPQIAPRMQQKHNDSDVGMKLSRFHFLPMISINFLIANCK